ncbi:MAG: transposase [Sphingopyxis sp.]|uniref:IS66-like element accessory protein TnpA n=1 Tax=Sphingopyxis sp. TaxID=1908224 RepID=UPI002ABC8BEB|nr:transposase [Sphingopyxis sp.]MDZ3832496.1 transposase [Sphingopyxis sp.]
MSEDIGAAGASALVTGHMSDRMSSRIAVVGGRRRWSVDQKLAILREAFGPDGSVSATCQRHAVGSGMLYTWRRQALSGDLTGTKRTPAPSFAEVEVSVPATAPAGSGQIGIALPSGVRITVDAAVDADALARVMSVLAR